MPGKRSTEKSKKNEKALKTPTKSSKANVAETSSSSTLSIITGSPTSASLNSSMQSPDKPPMKPKSWYFSSSSSSLTENLSGTTLEAQTHLCYEIDKQHLEKGDESPRRLEIDSEMGNSAFELNSLVSSDKADKPQITKSDISSDVNEQCRKSTVSKHPQSRCNDARCKDKKLGFLLATSGEVEHSKRPLHYTVDYHEMSRRFSHRTLAEIYDDEFFSYADTQHNLPNKSDLKEGIFCCMITGLVIASLVMTSYFIILLIDPITDSMDVLYELFYNLTNLVIGRQQRYHRHHN